MPFQKGHKLATGRPKGAVNRSTEMSKLSIARATNVILDTLPSDLEKIRKQDPAKAIDIALKLLEFNLPKMSRIEMQAEIEQKIQQITVNVTQKTVEGNE